MAIKIYSPTGEPFEVAKSRVPRLLLSGWTSTPPADKPAPAPVAETPSRGRKQVDPVTTGDEPVSESKED